MAMRQSIDAILQEAIQGEVESYELYAELVDRVKAPQVKETLQQLAQEELGHKANLEKMLSGPGQLRIQIRELQESAVQDYGIGDHLQVDPLEVDATFQDVCIFASKKEQQSYDVYNVLAQQSSGEVHALFAAMAKDEMRHKNLVERWYEEDVYQDF